MIGPVLRPLSGVLALVLCAGTLSSRPVQAGQTPLLRNALFVMKSGTIYKR
jgi:hypothetical protein